MINVVVIGALGKMGRTVCKAVSAEEDMVLAAAVDSAFADQAAIMTFGFDEIPVFSGIEECLSSIKPDVAVDFTIPSTVYKNAMACLEDGVHCVIGTTGLDGDQLDDMEMQAKQSNVNCFVAPNFAIGAVLLMEACRMIGKYMPSVEIIELHHDQKLDAPSGTSLRTADLIAEERGPQPAPAGPEGHAARGFTREGIPVHSVRLPGLVAHQEVIFGGLGQTLSLRHDSISRESFMPGVVMAVRKVADMKDHLVVGLENLL